MRKLSVTLLMILMLGAASLSAQSVNFKIGALYPTMNSDLWEVNLENLAYDKADMLDVYWAAELEMFMGRYFSLALEAGHYRQEIYSQYKTAVYDDGTPIYQDFFLRITSLEASFKLYPLGHRKMFNPYFGIGIGIYAWKYYQGGEFVDFVEETVYEGEAHTNAITPGFNTKVGFVYRFKHNMGISFETRYVYLKGNLSSLFEGFEKFDLSNVTFTMGVNFFLR